MIRLKSGNCSTRRYNLPHQIPTSGGFGEEVALDDPSRLLLPFYFLASTNLLNTYRISGFIQDTWYIDGDSASRFLLNSGIDFTIGPTIMKLRFRRE